MAFVKQIFYLMKQELQSARRSRYIFISFVIMPIFMWVLQGGVQVITYTTLSSTPGGQNIYITNNDNGNVSLQEFFIIPFDFENFVAGENISANTEFPLSKYLVESIKWQAETNENSTLYNSVIYDNLSKSEVIELRDAGKVDYWIKIDATFSQNYTLFNIAEVQLEYLPKGLTGSIAFQANINQILANKPFTIFEIKKVGYLSSQVINLGGDEGDTGLNFGVGFAGFIAILLAVIVPAPFISTSFAGEREKKTLESLLALPISRKGILMGKLFSGMVLVGVFAILNVVGMFLYNQMTQNVGSASGGVLAFDLSPSTIAIISFVMFLSAFIAIGLGISLASFAKDVRTSESMYQFVLMIPSMLVGLTGMFVGVPENLGESGLLLYLIPFSHSLAIFQKLLKPGFYEIKSLTGFGLMGDIIFHFTFLVISIAIVLYIASKVFEREGIVN